MENQSIFQQIIDIQLLEFYGWWQMSVCFFAFVALMAIWWHIGKRQNDFGQVWLALSVLAWSASGAVELYYADQFQEQLAPIIEKVDSQKGPDLAITLDQPTIFKLDSQSYQRDGWRSILSLLNSLFILLALPWFRYLPDRIEPIIQSKYWIYIVGLPFLFSLVPTINHMVNGQSLALSELDVYYAFLTLAFLGYVLWESFVRRRLQVLAWLSIACVLITIAAQVLKLSGSNIDQTLFSAIFKTSLIMIFFALALSWVKELAEDILPDPNKIRIAFDRVKDETGKYRHLLQSSGIPGMVEKKIPLSPAMFELAFKFAHKKNNPEDDWMEIKPKSEARLNKQYDIRDHNEVKRLLHAILDGVFGKGSWTKNKHELPLRNAMFEMSDKRERKIRLLVPLQNISIPIELENQTFS